MILTPGQLKHDECVDRALKAIRIAYDNGSQPTEEDCIDLVTDLYHLADDYGINMEAVLRCAASNYKEESR